MFRKKVTTEEVDHATETRAATRQMEFMAKQYAYDSRKRELCMALQTRVLTEEEMQEVMGHGTRLFVRNMVPYSEESVQKQFNEAVLQQYRIRTVVNPDARTRDSVHKGEK